MDVTQDDGGSRTVETRASRLVIMEPWAAEVVVEMKYGEAIRLHRGKRYLRNRPAPAVGE